MLRRDQFGHGKAPPKYVSDKGLVFLDEAIRRPRSVLQEILTPLIRESFSANRRI